MVTCCVINAGFMMFQSLIFLGKPTDIEFELMGLTANRVQAHPMTAYWVNPANSLLEFPDEKITKELAAKLPSSTTTGIYFVDVEQLPNATTDSEADWDKTITKLSSILHWLKQERPSILLGLYGVMPERQYWPHKRTREWKQRNTYFNRLSSYVDYVSPSLYTFYDDQQGWVEYAIDNIKEAKKSGKKVYPFIWPQYHQSSALAGQLIPGDYWRLQLETIYKHADGVIIWGGYKVDWSSSVSETDVTNWWYQTLDFMQKKGL